MKWKQITNNAANVLYILPEPYDPTSKYLINVHTRLHAARVILTDHYIPRLIIWIKHTPTHMYSSRSNISQRNQPIHEISSAIWCKTNITWYLLKYFSQRHHDKMARAKTNTQNDANTRATPWRNIHLWKNYMFVFFGQYSISILSHYCYILIIIMYLR